MEHDMETKYDKIDQIKTDAKNEKSQLISDKRELTQK